MNNIFFTIVIPTFNEEKFLPRLLSDLTEQTAKNFEVIVVDGGSTDKTIELAKKFLAKLNLQVIPTQLKNVCSQRNLGAKKGTGKYVQFFDADVQLSKTHLKQNMEGLIKYKYPSFATTFVQADSKSFYDKLIATFINIGVDLSVVINQAFVGGWNFIVRYDVFEKTKGFRKDVVFGEDTEYALRLTKAGYSMIALQKPRLIYSLRRYRAEGRVKSISKHLLAGIHMVFNGPITKNIFSYPMGGDWYKIPQDKKQKSTFIKRTKKFLKKLEKLME